MRRKLWLWPLLGGAFVACNSGDGSDIGPKFGALPTASSKVVVLDDQGRGVVGASVQLQGTSVRAFTGRNGRGDLQADPRGNLLVQIDGAAAVATEGDELGSLLVAMSSSGGDLTWPFYLPDVQASTGTAIPVGTQTVTTLIDDNATSGARVTIANGSSLGVTGGSATVTVRTGSLRSEHLTGSLPTSGAQAVLLGRGIYLDPPTFTCAPGATLDVTDDLALTSGTAQLYHLDPVTGAWGSVDTGITSSGGRLVSTGTIERGGLYAFGTPVVAGAVRGRVVDARALPLPLPGMAVTVDGRRATTASDGTFVVENVPATLADGAPRSATIEVFAGGAWMPARATATASMAGAATIDAGDLALDTLPAGNIRVQMITRGRATALRRCAISAEVGGVALVTTSDENGQTVFEDVPAEWFGFQDAYPLDSSDNYYARGIGFLDQGRRWADANQFYDELGWFVGSRRSRVLITDAFGGGPILDATLVTGSTDNAGFFGYTSESGTLFVDRPMDGRATATFRSARNGRLIVHAYSIERPNGEHLELPLLQALRTPLGAFDRHGLVQGTITGADTGREHRLRNTRRLDLQEWWDDVVDGIPLPSSLPIDIDPATTHGTFRAGIATAGGNLAVSELSTSSGITTLHKLGIAADLQPSEGQVVADDLPLILPAVATFVAQNAIVGLDPAIAASSLTFDLALQQPSGRVVDVVRGIGGNLSMIGADLLLELPALNASLSGHQWIAVLRGSATSSGVTVTQRSLLRLASSGPTTAVPLFAAPTITAPAAGATVPATGFTVHFALPAGVLYATIELRSDTGAELHLWQVTLPPEATEFAFKTLPVEADSPLVAGKTYSLVLSAYRSLSGPLVGKRDWYTELTSFVQTMGAVERGVDAVSSQTIQVTAN